MMSAMTIDHAATEIAEEELALEYALYDELLERWPDHWFGIVKGELIHAAQFGDVIKAVRSRGYGPGSVFVSKSPGPPPYRVR
jgi:hypothetical protein